MANQVEIVNFALSQVKGGFIESLSESSRESQVASRIWEIARDAALADVEPRWAQVQAVLTELTQTVTGYDYVYDYPSDCLKALKIYNAASDDDEDSIPFKIGAKDGLGGKTILCNEGEAELIYVAKVTNCGVFDPLFVEALAWKLAAYMAIPLKGDNQLQQVCSQGYVRSLGNAKALTKNEQWTPPDQSCAFLKARD